MDKIKNSSILYIEDDEITRESIGEFLKRVCDTVFLAQDGEEGLALFKEVNPQIVITDIEMPKMDGIKLSQNIRKINSTTQIIITTAYTNQEYLVKAVNLQLVKYIVKPLSIDKLIDALKLSAQFLDSKESVKKYFDESTFYDTFTKELLCDDKIVSLSKNERSFLELMLKNHPAPTSYEAIESNVYEFSSSKNAIKLLAKALRSKLPADAVENVFGYGYNIAVKEV